MSCQEATRVSPVNQRNDLSSEAPAEAKDRLTGGVGSRKIVAVTRFARPQKTCEMSANGRGPDAGVYGYTPKEDRSP